MWRSLNFTLMAKNCRMRTAGRLLPCCIHIDESLTAVSELFQYYTQKHECSFVYCTCTVHSLHSLTATVCGTQIQFNIIGAIIANDLITAISKGKLQAARALTSP